MRIKTIHSSFEGINVEYYEEIFLPDDNAKEEIAYIQNLIKNEKFIGNINKVIDYGCGTGLHTEILAERYDQVAGVDISEDMIKYAKEHHKKKNNRFIVSDVSRDCGLCGAGYDMAIALAHVIGYQTNNDSLIGFLKNIASSLKNGGVFIFNFYYLPAIYKNKLESQLRRIATSKGELIRFSNANIVDNENCLQLDYYYILDSDKDDMGNTWEIHEKMRFFSIPEIKYYLESAGFEIVRLFCYGADDRELSSEEWNAGCIVTKRADQECL